MKQAFIVAVKALSVWLFAANVWATPFVLAQSKADDSVNDKKLELELESEEAELEDEEDIVAETLEDLEDDFSDVQQKIVQVEAQGKDVSSFQKMAQEVKALLERANSNLEKGNRGQTQRDMDEALARLKSLNDEVTTFPGAEIEEEIIDEEIKDEEDIDESEAVPQEQKTEKVEKRNIVARIVSGVWGWITGLFS